MRLIEKLEPLLLALAAVLGLVLGRLTPLGDRGGPLVQPLLILMLLGIFWDIPVRDLRRGFQNLKFAATSLVINFVWIPILGYILALIFLSSSGDLQIGYVMLLVTPCTDWYLVFTAMARGNVPLSASMLPLNLIIQLLLLPVYLGLFGGIYGQSAPLAMIMQIVPILLVPLAAARLLARLAANKPKLAALGQKIFPGGRFWYLFLAVLCMFAGEGGTIVERPDIFVLLLAPVLLFFLTNFVLVQVAAKLMKFDHQDSVSLGLTTLARNSPVALTVAIGAFPDRPLIALALIVGPLIELPVLALTARALLVLGGMRGVGGDADADADGEKIEGGADGGKNDDGTDGVEEKSR
ncbi:MAG: bile acid:sodium symporter [Deltaproteobacteria bacterium]|nr:bile acid:sodium symporter [Deltaproteobacteria bacterium]